MKDLLYEKFLIFFYRIFSPKLYTSIHDEGSAYIWYKIQETQDYSLLIKEKGIKISLLHTNKIVKAWEGLNSQYIIEFPPTKFLENLAIRAKISLWRWRAVAHNERKYNTLAAIEESKLESKKSNTIEKGGFMKNITYMNKLNMNINYLKISLFEYESHSIALSK